MESKMQLSTTGVMALALLLAAQAAEPAEKAFEPLQPSGDSEIQERAYTSPIWYMPAKG